MRKFCDSKIAILGMGYLMEYIEPCYKTILGDHMKNNIVAVTADKDDLARKRSRFPFPVLLDDNLGALKELRPHLIFIAPPPKYVPDVIQTALVPYFQLLRSEGQPLPLLYSFAPTPVGTEYLKLLGEDVHVVHILPNMVSEIGGQPLVGEGLTYLTFPDESPWPEKERKFLDAFFKPLGGTIEVKPGHVMQMLAGTVVVHTISELIFAVADGLEQGGQPMDYRLIATEMDRYHRERYHLPQQDGNGQKELALHLSTILHRVVSHWTAGIHRFYLDCGMDAHSADAILGSLMDLHLRIHQCEDREAIQRKAKQHATKGGVLEKGMELFQQLVEEDVKSAFYAYPNARLDACWLEKKAYQITQVVAEHGKQLSAGSAPQPFQVENHAITFALFAKHMLACGIPGAQSALAVGVIEYAKERGSRMRQRCDYFGDPVNMLGYKVYCEWQPEKVPMTVVDIQKSPVHKTEVRECRWCTIWKEHDMLQYGKYYCDYADYHLVKGFCDDMYLEMSKIFSRGADSCGFTWWGADLTPENETWIKTRRAQLIDRITENWEYHTAHLYHTLIRHLYGALGSGAKIIEEGVRREYVAYFSHRSLAIIDSFAHTDFSIARIHP